jgi:pyruvate dehydrogenase E2 component (dihydrolipoamide acetyltransferase)
MSADAPAAPTGAKGAVHPIEPTAAQRTAARRVAESKATIPEFTASIEVGTTDLPAVVAAAGRALREHANVNGAYVDAKYQHYARANVAVAVAGVFPTVADADAKDAATIAAELADAEARVKDGTITSAALSGATFAITSLASFGVGSFTAIIQPGHAAALAVGATTLTLSADARIVSPADAGAFLARLRELLDGAAA